MFALVQNNTIVVGPREWSYWVFKDYLEQNLLNSSQLPITFTDPVITEEWKLLPITELVEPQHDSLFQQYAGPYWTIYDTYITGYYNVIDSSIDLIKSHLKNKIASNRYDLEVQGFNYTFPDNVVVGVYTSREDRSVYLDALIVMGDNDTIDFKFQNSIFKSVTKAQLQSIVGLGSQHIKNAFAWESSKILEIDNAATIDDLKLITVEYQS